MDTAKRFHLKSANHILKRRQGTCKQNPRLNCDRQTHNKSQKAQDPSVATDKSPAQI
eukprot:m.64250 g.64250  ORF g.64250 m.64250 type:complete len:57 (+) comp11995_c0_seq1:147-317(+)